MGKEHNYSVSVTWTGNKGEGTSDYRKYERSHTIAADGKPDIEASSDTPFRGDHTKHNPETLLLSSLSACHMLWYLHLCADAGIVVTAYTDDATGTMIEVPTGGGHFTEVTLHPAVTITDSAMIAKANELHDKAHEKCFIANSMNFPVGHEPSCSATN
jgi:organic hydroperoxide reductase OsmC/OhrA